jgi:cytoskeletal protein RodZ
VIEDFGTYLRREREARGLSLGDVAQRTRIKERWLQLIEEAQLDQLPAEVFVRGFVRAYARSVGGDEATAARLLEQGLAERRGAALAEAAERTAGPAARSRRRLLLALLLVALAAAAAAAIGVGLRRRAPTSSLRCPPLVAPAYASSSSTARSAS